MQRADSAGRAPSKLAGFLLLPAGAIIVLAAIALLPAVPMRAVFALAGAGVQVLGLVIAVRAHAAQKGIER